MGTLDGPAFQHVLSALVNAIRPEEFPELFRVSTSKRLEDIVAPASYRGTVRQALEYVESRDEIDRFLLDARQANPKNLELASAAEDVALGGDVVSHLEKQIPGQFPLFDPADFRAAMIAAENRVCQIRVQAKADGTAFLVGPDKIMTNYHVVEPALGITSPSIEVLFDYRAQRATSRQIPVADNWLVDSSPGSDLDERPMPGREPTTAELDYAILRLAEPIGSQPPHEAATEGRGWVDLTLGPIDATTGQVVLIMQQPGGGPTRCAAGTFDGVNTEATRMRYKVETLGGSSGSPCFSLGWQFLGLHNGSEPAKAVASYNQGIPFRALAEALRAKGILSELAAD